MRIRPRLHAILLASALIVALATACGNERRALPVALPDGATLQFDAAMIPPTDAGASRDLGRDSGPRDAGPTLPPATVNPDGVLTPFPHIRFEVTPAGFQIVSVNFAVEEDGDSRGPLLQAYIEIRNTGSTLRCGFLPDIFLGYREILGRLDADPYYQLNSGGAPSTVTSDCIAPGGVGVIDGVQRGITEADLAAATSLTVDVGPYDYSFATYNSAIGDVSIIRSIVPVTDGFALSGTVTPLRTIYNFALYVYVRDERGVLFEKLSAFPGVLETLPSFVAQPYETDAAPRAFATYLSFPGWINR